VYSAVDGAQTLESTTSGVDVILVDYEMPEMNGLEFLKWMRTGRRETPVIMLTAYDSGAVAEQAMKLGAYDYLRKDKLDLNILTHAIDATHERHLYRIEQQFEEQRLREMGLDSKATDKARDVLSTVSPPLNTAIANINFELEVKSEDVLRELAPTTREKVKSMVENVLKEVRVLETSVRGLLTLYRILYAHHAEQDEIDEIKKELEKNLKSGPGR
jgi:CheY-like chemotaxis protein